MSCCGDCGIFNCSVFYVDCLICIVLLWINGDCHFYCYAVLMLSVAFYCSSKCRSNECHNAECCGTKWVYLKFDFNQTKKRVFFNQGQIVCLCFKTVSRNICISQLNKIFTLVIYDHNKAALLSCSFAIGMGLTKLFIGLNCLSILMAELSI